MTLRKSVFIALAFVLTTPVATSSEAVWPKNSASDLSIFVTVLRFRIYAEHCSAKVPPLMPKFASLVEHLDSHIHDISKGLLTSDVFKGMKDKPVPAEIIDGLKDSFDDMKHNVERQDAASVCPKALHDFGEMDDDSLKSGLKEVLTSVQNMIQKFEKKSARQERHEPAGNPTGGTTVW